MGTDDALTCAHCGRDFQRGSNHGPAPLYCRPSCRTRAYERRRAARRAAAEKAFCELLEAVEGGKIGAIRRAAKEATEVASG